MKPLRLRNSSFDVAPLAPRYTRTAWLVFAGGLLFLLVCASLLALSARQHRDVRAAIQHADSAQLMLAATQREAQARPNDPSLVQRARGQESLQQMIRMSWFGLFDALEEAARAVRGGVSLLSLVPAQTQAAATQVRLTAVAASTALMLEYVRRLRQDPRILSIEINSQQPDEKVGPGVVRLQLTVLWNPQLTVQRPAVEPARTTPSGLVAEATVKRPPVVEVVVQPRAP